VADQEAGSSGGVVNIRVLASGQILLEGREVSLSELDDALYNAKLEGSTVLYDRENPDTAGPPEAEAVMKLITANRLRIAFAPQPDRPSKVIEFPGIETFFAKIRRQAAGHRGVSLVRADQVVYNLPAPPQGSISPQMVEGVNSVVSSEQIRNIAAVAAADALAGDPSKPPTLPDVARQVPFFGLLIGFAYVGHAVWIFEAIPAMMPSGCEDADILIVDSNAIATLPEGWVEDAGAIMRNPNILVYDRSRHKVGAMRTAGEVPGRIEFPN
jgi:hypothetical protein